MTFTRDGELLGCQGTVKPEVALSDDVHANALRAAFSDSRFPPLDPTSLEGVVVTVSVLSPLVPVTASSMHDVVDALEPGTDGVILSHPNGRAVLLPYVWDREATAAEFVTAAAAKAGFDAGAWPENVSAWRFRVQSCSGAVSAEPAGCRVSCSGQTERRPALSVR